MDISTTSQFNHSVPKPPSPSAFLFPQHHQYSAPAASVPSFSTSMTPAAAGTADYFYYSNVTATPQDCASSRMPTGSMPYNHFQNRSDLGRLSASFDSSSMTTVAPMLQHPQPIYQPQNNFSHYVVDDDDEEAERFRQRHSTESGFNNNNNNEGRLPSTSRFNYYDGGHVGGSVVHHPQPQYHAPLSPLSTSSSPSSSRSSSPIYDVATPAQPVLPFTQPQQGGHLSSLMRDDDMLTSSWDAYSSAWDSHTSSSEDLVALEESAARSMRELDSLHSSSLPSSAEGTPRMLNLSAGSVPTTHMHAYGSESNESGMGQQAGSTGGGSLLASLAPLPILSLAGRKRKRSNSRNQNINTPKTKRATTEVYSSRSSSPVETQSEAEQEEQLGDGSKDETGMPGKLKDAKSVSTRAKWWWQLRGLQSQSKLAEKPVVEGGANQQKTKQPLGPAPPQQYPLPHLQQQQQQYQQQLQLLQLQQQQLQQQHQAALGRRMVISPPPTPQSAATTQQQSQFLQMKSASHSNFPLAQPVPLVPVPILYALPTTPLSSHIAQPLQPAPTAAALASAGAKPTKSKTRALPKSDATTARKRVPKSRLRDLLEWLKSDNTNCVGQDQQRDQLEQC